MAFRGDSTATYTYASGSTGGTVDMGARNNYRYVNAQNVYSKGKTDGVTVHTGTYNATTRSNSTGIDLTASHSYRYIRTDNVPNSNSGTYTFATNDTGGTKDLGTTNTYRYVNATNVYNKGKVDGKAELPNISLFQLLLPPYQSGSIGAGSYPLAKGEYILGVSYVFDYNTRTTTTISISSIGDMNNYANMGTITIANGTYTDVNNNFSHVKMTSDGSISLPYWGTYGSRTISRAIVYAKIA